MAVQLPLWLVLPPTALVKQSEDLLGSGGSSQIFGGLLNGNRVAIKQPKEGTPTDLLSKEIDVWSQLQHANVVSLLGVAGLPSVLLAMELMEFSLLYLVSNVRYISWPDRLRYTRDLASAIAYLHEKGFVHRDITSGNVLFTTSTPRRVKLADFGLTCRLSEIETVPAQQGTAKWMAPELFEDGQHPSTAADIYGFGVVCFEFLCLSRPWGALSDGDAIQLARQGQRPEVPDDLQPQPPAGYVSLMRACWDSDPQRRPSASDVVARIDAIIGEELLRRFDAELEPMLSTFDLAEELTSFSRAGLATTRALYGLRSEQANQLIANQSFSSIASIQQFLTLIEAVNTPDSLSANVSLLIEARAPLDAADSHGWTALHWVARANTDLPNIAQQLIEAGASAHPVDGTGRTPLHVAAAAGNIETVLVLVAKKVPVEIEDNEGCTPLRLAVDKGHVELARQLIEFGAQPDPAVTARMLLSSSSLNAMFDGQPLLWAAQHANPELVRRLLVAGAQTDATDANNRSPLHLAVMLNSVETMAQLLDRSPEVANAQDKDGCTALHFAAREGQAVLVAALLHAGANVNLAERNGYVPLHFAAREGHVEVVEQLLGAHASIEAVDTCGTTAVHLASRYDRVEVLRLLISAGAALETPDQDGWTPMHLAASKGNLSTLQTLIDAGASLEPHLGDNRTPLHWAASTGHVDATRLLIGKGANVNAEDTGGRTVLHWTALTGKAGTAAVLVENGGDFTRADDDGQTALQMAMSTQHWDVARVFISVPGANPTPDVLAQLLQPGSQLAASFEGEPLHWAVRNKRPALLDQLIAAGAEVDARDRDGVTALQVAVRRVEADLAVRLLAAGALVDQTTMRLLLTPGSVLFVAVDQTPLHWAVRNDRIDLLHHMVQAGAQLDAVDKDGVTPVAAAARLRRTAMVQALLIGGAHADDDVVRSMLDPSEGALGPAFENLPLHWAVHNRCATLAQQLIDAGAHVDANNRNCLTPLHVAIQMGDSALARLLIEGGADISLAGLSARTLADDCVNKWPALLVLPGLQLLRSYVSWISSLNLRDVSNDTAARLPLSNWKTCAVVDLTGNPRLTEIPLALRFLNPERVQRISFDPPTASWNALEAQIATQSARDIIAYAQIKTDAAPVNALERRLLVLGPARAGKTTLVRRLRGLAFSRPQVTDGLAVSQVSIPSIGARLPVRLNVWELAGRACYRHTHMMFVRDPDLSLLVFDLTADADESVRSLIYYCQTLLCRANCCRVLLAGTHLDRCATTASAERTARAVYQQLRDALPGEYTEMWRQSEPILVSCTSESAFEQSVQTLKQALLTAAGESNPQVPASSALIWPALRGALHRSLPVLPLSIASEKIIAYARRVGHHLLATDKDVLATTLLNTERLGQLLLFEGRDGHVTHVVTDPQWLGRVLASIATSKQTDSGRFSAAAAWGNERTIEPQTYPLLISMLQDLRLLAPFHQSTLDTTLFYAPNHSESAPAPAPPPPSSLIDMFGMAPAPPPPGLSPFPAASSSSLASSSSTRPDSDDSSSSSSSSSDGPLKRSTSSSSSSSSLVVPRLFTSSRTSVDLDLSYDSPRVNANQVYLLPARCQTEQPDLRFTWRTMLEKRTWRRMFALCEGAWASMPETVMPRIIVEILQQLANNLETLVVWQQGAVLRVPPGTASDAPQIFFRIRRTANEQIELKAKSPPHCSPSWIAPWLERLTNVVEQQLAVQHRISAELRVICPLGARSKPCYLPYEELRTSLHKQHRHLGCQPYREHRLRVEIVAPELVLSQQASASLLFDWQRVTLAQEVSSSRWFGKIMTGRLEHENDAPLIVTVRVVGELTHCSEQLLFELQHEVFLLRLIHHPNVLPPLGLCVPTPINPGMGCVMEGAIHATLFDALSDRSRLLLAHQLSKEIVDAEPEDPNTPRKRGQVDQVFDRLTRRLESLAFENETLVPLVTSLHCTFSELNSALNGTDSSAQSSSSSSSSSAADRLTSFALQVDAMLMPLSWLLRFKIATDIVQGLMHLHSMNPPLSHRGVSSSNVFLTGELDDMLFDDESGWRSPLAKLGDFGLSLRLGLGDEQHSSLFLAPEVNRGEPHNTASDVYSFGILLWELLLPPLSNEQRHLPPHERRQQWLECRPGQPGSSSDAAPSLAELGDDRVVVDEYRALVSSCTAEDPAKRPGIIDVYCRLRSMSQRPALPVFFTLPDLSTVASSQFAPQQHAASSVQHDYHVSVATLELQSRRPDAEDPSAAEIEKIRLQRPSKDNSGLFRRNRTGPQASVALVQAPSTLSLSVGRDSTLLQVLCMEYSCGYFWLGMADGQVAAVAFEKRQGTETVPCLHIDQHAKGVNVLSANPNQRQTVWSGSSDGRIIAWRDRPLSLEETKNSFDLQACFSIVDSSLPLVRKGSDLHLDLRDGRMYFFASADRCGLPLDHIDICRVDLLVACGDILTVAANSCDQLWLSLASSSRATLQRWHQAIANLVQATKSSSCLRRLASSPARSGAIVSALQSVGVSTWSLTDASNVELCEWHLRSEHEDVSDGTDNDGPEDESPDPWIMVPGRQLVIDFTNTGLRTQLWGATKIVRVSSSTMWLAVANCLASVAIDDSAPVTSLRWPKTAPRHKSPIRIAVLVQSKLSPSGYEVWTHAPGERFVFIWATPTDAAGEDQCPGAPIAEIDLGMSFDSIRLTSMLQVSANEVWAGTDHGIVIGWNVATRQSLPALPLDAAHRHQSSTTSHPRPVTALCALPFNSSSDRYAVSASHEPSVRRIFLTTAHLTSAPADTSADFVVTMCRTPFAYNIIDTFSSDPEGTVFDVTCCEPGHPNPSQHYELRVWKRTGKDSPFRRVVDLLGQLPSHPNVIRLFTDFVGPPLDTEHEWGLVCYSVTEHLPLTLRACLKAEHPTDWIPTRIVVALLLQVALALEHLELHNVVHGNVNLDSLLIDAAGSDKKEDRRIVLSGFSRARFLRGNYTSTTAVRRLQEMVSFDSAGRAMTDWPGWASDSHIAPELLTTRARAAAGEHSATVLLDFGKQSTFEFAVLAYEIMTGEGPIPGYPACCYDAATNQFTYPSAAVPLVPCPKDTYPMWLLTLLRNALTPRPNDRPTITSIVQKLKSLGSRQPPQTTSTKKLEIR